MTGDVMTLMLALGLAVVILGAFGKKPAKSITGWFTVVFPPKKKGGKRKGR